MNQRPTGYEPAELPSCSTPPCPLCMSDDVTLITPPFTFEAMHRTQGTKSCESSPPPPISPIGPSVPWQDRSLLCEVPMLFARDTGQAAAKLPHLCCWSSSSPREPNRPSRVRNPCWFHAEEKQMAIRNTMCWHPFSRSGRSLPTGLTLPHLQMLLAYTSALTGTAIRGTPRQYGRTSSAGHLPRAHPGTQCPSVSFRLHPETLCPTGPDLGRSRPAQVMSHLVTAHTLRGARR